MASAAKKDLGKITAPATLLSPNQITESHTDMPLSRSASQTNLYDCDDSERSLLLAIFCLKRDSCILCCIWPDLGYSLHTEQVTWTPEFRSQKVTRAWDFREAKGILHFHRYRIPELSIAWVNSVVHQLKHRRYSSAASSSLHKREYCSTHVDWIQGLVGQV